MADRADLQAQLDALRASGAAERDPVRFAYLDALARRAAGQAEPIRQSLMATISTAANELATRPAPAPPEIAPTSTVSPLADLLNYIGDHAHEPPQAFKSAIENTATNGNFRRTAKSASPGRAGQSPELKSVAYFHKTWSKLSTEQQLTQTLANAPENAGPMNSQHLVLRSLQVMNEIAPDYLQGFMSSIDTLIWLEHAAQIKPAAALSSGSEGEKKARIAKRSAKNR
jgi:hypothetical protein